MKHVMPLSVRTYECDSSGHVNHAVYVNYLEHARVEFLRAANYDYLKLVETGYSMVIARLEIDYRLPAFAGDDLTIESEPLETRQASGWFRQTIRRGETVLAEARVRWCVVDRDGRPSRPPDGFELQGLGK